MKKIFTFIAVALLSLTANASDIMWDKEALENAVVSFYGLDPSDDKTENNSYKGITITGASQKGYGGFFWDNDDQGADLYAGVDYGMDPSELGAASTFTFTSTVGFITKIVFNLTTPIEGGIDNEGWTIDETTATWEGTPTAIVNLTSADLDMYFSSVVFTVIDPVAVPNADFAIDFRQGQLGTDEYHLDKYLVVDAEGNQWFYDDGDEPEINNGNFYAAQFNGNLHGYVSLKANLPLAAGNYKLTLGACQYGNGAGTVQNFYPVEKLADFNQNLGEGKCYHNNTEENVVSVVFTVETDGQVVITCGSYTPYFKLEKLTSKEYNITYVVEDAAGIIPSVETVIDGEKLTIPANRTFYKEGYSFIYWTDGVENYTPGQKIAPESDMTLTAVFRANTADLLTSTSEITVKWEFGIDNGAGKVHFENNSGFIVTQAIVDGETQDVKLDIDATSGKFDNIHSADKKWCQVGTGTKLTLPSKKDITATMKVLYDPTTDTKLNGNAYTSWEDNIATFTTDATAATSEFVIGGGTWYGHLQVVYPASEVTAIDNTSVDTKAVKRIVDGQVLIERNGELYTLQGQLVK